MKEMKKRKMQKVNIGDTVRYFHKYVSENKIRHTETRKGKVVWVGKFFITVKCKFGYNITLRHGEYEKV